MGERLEDLIKYYQLQIKNNSCNTKIELYEIEDSGDKITFKYVASTTAHTSNYAIEVETKDTTRKGLYRDNDIQEYCKRNIVKYTET